MSGRVTPTISGKRWRFPGVELPPTFLTFVVSLGTIMVPVGVSFSLLTCYNEHILSLKVLWKATSLPSWTYLVLIGLRCVL